MKPLVSVIIPYYNRPQKLLRALNAVYQQTHTNIEVIVVDDASTVPPEGLETFTNLIVLKNPQNSGPGISRNKGMQEATGTYLAFLDCDDYWAPEFLAECLQAFETATTPIVFVYANSYNVNQTEKQGLRHGKLVTNTQILPDIFISGRPWCTSACLWKRILLRETPWIEARTWEDYAFDVEAALKCNQVAVIKKPLVFYEVGGNDKLSDQAKDKTEKEKTKALIHIAKKLANTPLGKQPFMHYKLEALLTARLLYKVRNNELIKPKSTLLQEYEKYSGQWKTAIIRILLKTIRKGAIKLLEKQKLNANLKADAQL